MIYAGESGDKADVPWILAATSPGESIERFKSVRSESSELIKSSNPIDVLTTSAPTTTQDGGHSEAGEKEDPSTEVAVVVNSGVVMIDQAVALVATIPEVDETTIF